MIKLDKVIPRVKVHDPIIGISGYLSIPKRIIIECNIDTTCKYNIYPDDEIKDILYFIKGNVGISFKNSTESSRIYMVSTVKRLKIKTPNYCSIAYVKITNVGEGFIVKFN